MSGWPRTVGIVLGLVLGALILALSDGLRRDSAYTGKILSECGGRMSELVIHYEPGSRELVETVYRQFLSQLDSGVTVHAVCPERAAFEELIEVVGNIRCRLNPVVVNHPITTWSRDRWVALQTGGDDPCRVTVLSPRGEAGSEVWPARAGDERVGQDLARVLGGGVRARRSGLLFDGGDFLADEEAIFIVPRVLERNIQQSVEGRDQFIRAVGAELNRRVILLNQSPDHHAAMFMYSIGNRTVLVGDPRLGRALLCNSTELPGGPDFTPETQGLFDAVASQCAAEGYTVHRIPTVPAMDGRTYLTYVNVLIEEQDGRRWVYMPVYEGFDSLNIAARRVWESLGFEVRPIDCTSTYRQFGCLHCLVNVLSRT